MASYTQAQLDAIRAAIARGERTVQFSDRAVTYRSMEELLAAEQRIASDLASRPKQSLGYAVKGF